MPTFLFDKIIFGPVVSRRLGDSLGINLLPATRKVCNFNCIYCECGWTMNSGEDRSSLPSRKDVYNALDLKLSELKDKNRPPDVITFAGNGEPTLHPDFPGIVDDTIELRNKHFPATRIAVLSNSTTITIPHIREALLKVDQNILKLDSGFDLTVKSHNQPRVNFKVAELIRNLKDFNGQLIIQTLFLRGTYRGRTIDNTTPEELEAWLRALEIIRPEEVMIYTISRDTPDGGELAKVPEDELHRIASMVNRLGIRTSVSG
ncbi:MAG: radical SAM protein [Bacteroidales bacterium]|jgi:wyosine [tRNA(Phe)-imidazoG37] synthetase (radical SAM superfamily)|nr:radical SAM protein [Bacteroidales bacterium]